MTMKCSSCSSEMIDGYVVKLDNSPLANFVLCNKGKLTKIDVRVCPCCGKIDLYSSSFITANKKEG